MSGTSATAPRVLHFSAADDGGGAPRAAYRLHAGLIAAGHRSQMLVAERHHDTPGIERFQPSGQPWARLRRRLWQRAHRFVHDRARAGVSGRAELFDGPQTAHGDAALAQAPAADLWHLHWTRGLIDPGLVLQAAGRRPVVWTLLDMGALTGGCHYDFGCGRFAARCGHCPQLGRAGEHDWSRRLWRHRQRRYATGGGGPRQIVAPSAWLASQVARSSLLGNWPCTTIPLGVDAAAYAPRDRTAARAALDVPAEHFVVAFVADRLPNPRKGGAVLAAALADWPAVPPLTVLLVGRGGGKLALAGADVRDLGPVGDDGLLSVAYAAADVLAVPSQQEAFGLVAAEAMACGTPVVASADTGLADVVAAGDTGLLAAADDPAAWRQALQALAGDAARRAAMGRAGRARVEARFTLQTVAAAYADLYAELAAAAPGTSAP